MNGSKPDCSISAAIARKSGYTPHLTLGRAKSEADGLALAPELSGLREWDGGRTTIDEVLVFSSVLERDGPVYTVLGRGELKGR